MIKTIGLMKRKEGMSLEDCHRHWLEVHAPIVIKTPGIRRYIQSHSIPELYDKHPQAYDGMAEIWYDSLEDYYRVVNSESWQEAVQDGPNFIGSIARLMVTEVPIIDAHGSPRERQAAGMVKYCGLLTRRPHLDVPQFQQHWREIHAPLVVSELTGMVRYIQSHAIPETYGGPLAPAYDGVPQAWFESLEKYPIGLGRRTEGPGTTPATIDSIDVFMQPIPSIVTREYVILDEM